MKINATERHFNMFLYSVFARLGSSVAQLPLVPVGWAHSQEVSHLDTHTAPGYLQKVSPACACSPWTVYMMKQGTFDSLY